MNDNVIVWLTNDVFLFQVIAVYFYTVPTSIYNNN